MNKKERIVKFLTELGGLCKENEVELNVKPTASLEVKIIVSDISDLDARTRVLTINAMTLEIAEDNGINEDAFHDMNGNLVHPWN